jgi:TolB-like protein
MADIFISYSRHDSEQAQLLTELLTSAGLSVWIDQSGIIGAEKWATEIVEGINSCSTFLLLISPHSVESENVLRELSLASEKRKRVLPVDLEAVRLPTSFEYPLAGIHRVAVTDFDAIIRAHKYGVTKIVVKDMRKSLMVLPFDDLSPAGDNEWFSNGIVTELIGLLSNVKALRVTDQQTTKEFKHYKGHLSVYASEMNIRFFVEGSVRKFGDQIKVSSSLLDIDTGDNLWQDSMKGTMEDLFDIQETVARRILDGLAIMLTTDEEKKLDKKPTENAEAYELYLKGSEYYARRTKRDFERAISLFEEAVRVDPRFVAAHAEIAIAYGETYRLYDRNPTLLKRVRGAAEKVRELEGETAKYFWVMCKLALLSGDAEGALRLAQQAIEIDPKYAGGYDALGYAYEALGNKEAAVNAREALIRLEENHKGVHFSLLVALHGLGDKARLRAAAERAIPIFERHTRLNPDDYHTRAILASVHWMSGSDSKALRAADELSAVESLDGDALYNLACLYLNCNTPDRGMENLRRAVAKGFRAIETFRRDPDLAPLRDPSSPYHAEFEELMKELE